LKGSMASQRLGCEASILRKPEHESNNSLKPVGAASKRSGSISVDGR
jgi:hypothetical protein